MFPTKRKVLLDFLILMTAEFMLPNAKGQSFSKKETFSEEGQWQLYFLEVLLKFR